MWKKALLVATITVAFLLSTSSTAFAQTSEEEAALWAGGGLAATISTSISAVGFPITTIAGVVILVVMLTDDANGQLEAYLRNNSVGLQHDLYLGGGETADDLAGMFQVPPQHREEFADILYENREDLADLAEPGGVDSESARQFGEIVIEQMLDNREMTADLVGQFG